MNKNNIVLLLVFLLLTLAFPSSAFSTPVPPQYPAGTSIDQEMNDLWNGNANFQIIQTMKLPTPGSSAPNSDEALNEGTQIVALNGVWYLFNREYDYVTKAYVAQTLGGNYCNAGAMRIVVRSSTNKGQTWSPEVVVASPNLNPALLGSQKTECQIGDGFAYWDGAANPPTWHYIAQVLDTNSLGQRIWNINHYTYTPPAGMTSPMAQFTADILNPVIQSGGLWSIICNYSNQIYCPKTTAEEGTPEISYKKVDESGNSFYYVTFHGVNITNTPNGGGSNVVYGYRGIAKTPDFHSWIPVNTGDLPNAPIWSSKDCQQWDVPWNPSTGCVGGGMGSSLITPTYTYMLVEGTDMTVGCATGQHWTHGLVRNPNPDSFPVTGTWQHFGYLPNATNPATGDPVAKPHNPLLNANYPGGKPTCGATTPANPTPEASAYARLFTDNNTVYLTYWTYGADGVSNWFHIARLQPVATSPVTNFYALNSNNPTNNPSNIIMQLASGSEIDLNSGNYPEASDYLALGTDGNLVLYNSFGFPQWSSNTGGQSCAAGACTLSFLSGGKLAMSNNGVQFWTPATAGTCMLPLPYKATQFSILPTAPYLELIDQNVIIWTAVPQFDLGNLILQPSVAEAGFAQPNGQVYWLAMVNGNLALYQGTQSGLGNTVWSSNSTSDCTGSCEAIFQTDGNFVLYNNSTAYWATNTWTPSLNARWLSFSPTAPYLNILNGNGAPVWNASITN